MAQKPEIFIFFAVYTVQWPFSLSGQSLFRDQQSSIYQKFTRSDCVTEWRKQKPPWYLHVYSKMAKPFRSRKYKIY